MSKKCIVSEYKLSFLKVADVKERPTTKEVASTEPLLGPCVSVSDAVLLILLKGSPESIESAWF